VSAGSPHLLTFSAWLIGTGLGKGRIRCVFDFWQPSILLMKCLIRRKRRDPVWLILNELSGHGALSSELSVY
jgi:hypothetical protein